MEYKVNRFVNFLRSYGPILRNDSMYDETIQRLRHRGGFEPICFETPHFARICDALQSDPPKSIILTGTAGDGKTYLCREVWEHFGGAFDDWDANEKEHCIRLPTGLALVIIKDLSKLQAEEKVAHLTALARSVHEPTPSKLFLVAANDGQLVEAMQQLDGTHESARLRSAVENALVDDSSECSGLPLLLLNLSRTDSAELLQKVIDGVLNHVAWAECSDCLGSSAEPRARCPIRENRERLGDPVFRNRLTALLQVCDHNGYHLPIRQVLILVTNAILGHPDVREHLMTCRDVARGAHGESAARASVYTNVFGGNLRRRVRVSVFEVLSGLGVGEETNNRIDGILIFGKDDPTLHQLFTRLLASDVYYGCSAQYQTLQQAYLDGVDEDAEQQFMEHLTAQRQRLFFTVPEADIAELRPWDLTVFQFAGEYLDQLIPALRETHRPPKRIVERLVRGLNRVFTGMLTQSGRNVWLATSGSHSQCRVARLVESVVSLEPDRGQQITLDLVRNRVHLCVDLDREARVVLPLNVIRYEFLSRVAEGSLPSSFSKECYEDILSFKARLMAKLNEITEKQPSPDELQLRLLDLDPRGQLVDESIAIILEGRG